MDEEEIYSDVKDDEIDWKSTENIYVNKDVCHAVKSNKSGATLSDLEGSDTVKKRSCIATALILGLLCLLLLAGLIILLVLYTKGNSNWEIKMLNQTSCNNMTDKNHQLQMSYNNLELQSQCQALQWTYFNGSFYCISSTMKSWQDSRTYCQQMGADLVIINSPEEKEFIQTCKLRAWIGLTDLEKKFTWKWVDGTLLGNLSYWAAGEPNDAGGAEDCVELVFYGDSWNDAQCSNQDYWICER